MTERQLEIMIDILNGMARDISAIRGLLEKQQAPRSDDSTNALSGVKYAASKQVQVSPE